jgi:phage tail-like protein
MAEQTAAQGTVGTPEDPYRDYNFRIVINNVTEGYFVQCSGLSVRSRTIAYRQGGDATTRRLPGPVEYGEVTLSFGLTASSRTLWDWFQSTVRGQVERRFVTIVLLNSDGSQGDVSWNLTNAWISEWHAPAFNALGKDAAIGHVTIVSDEILAGAAQ